MVLIFTILVVMTFAQLLEIFKKRWWLPLVTTVLFTSIGLGFFSPQIKYQVNISFNITTKNDKEIVQEAICPDINKALVEIDPEVWGKVEKSMINKEHVYFKVLRTIKSYFMNRFNSVDIQAQIANQIGYSTDNLRRQSPFYSIVDYDLGGLGFEFVSTDRNQVEKFDEAVSVVFENIVQEWNQEKDVFAVRLLSDYTQASVILVRPNLQQYALPIVAGFVFGLALAFLLPKSKNKFL